MTEDMATYEAVLKEMRRDCDTCARPEPGSQVCPLRSIDIDTCLTNSSRPFWRPKSGAPCGTCKNDDGHDISKCVHCDGENNNFESKSEPANKFDQGNPRYDLLPGDVLEEVTLIFTMGAEKDGARNWEKGMSWGRVFGAAMRHMWAFWTGKTTDQESGRPHLAHAIVNLMFLLAYYTRGIGTDDRSGK